MTASLSRPLGTAVAALAVAAALGVWFTTLNVDPAGNAAARLAQTLGRGVIPWPFVLPAAGLAGGAAIFALKALTPPIPGDRSGMMAEICVVFLPGLALFFQGAVAFLHFGVFGDEALMGGLAVLDFLVFLGIGNYVATARYGASTGLRTPWTLKSEAVWAKAHRVLGRGLVAISLAGFGALFVLEPKTAIFAHVAALLTVKLSTVIYAAALGRGEERRHA